MTLLAPGAVPAPTGTTPAAVGVTTDPTGPSAAKANSNGSCCGHQAPTLALSPDHASAGDSVTATIACFDGTIGSATQALYVDSPGGGMIPLTRRQTATAEITSATATFTVPDNIEPGSHTLSTTCGGQASFTVDRTTPTEPPALTVTPTAGKPGSEITYRGTNLPECDGRWSVEFDGTSLGQVSGEVAERGHRETVPADAGPGTRVAALVCRGGPTVSTDFIVGRATPPTTTTTTTTTTGPVTTPAGSTTTTIARTIASADPTTEVVTEPEDAGGSLPFAAVAVAGLVSLATAGGVAATRSRKPGRWVDEHVVTRPDPGPSSVAVQPPDGDRDDHSIRFDLRGDSGSQAIEEDRDDPDRDDPD
ncbi:hypothetical protein GCM10023094_45350 [Rhodococcus olei]|uniref:Ig-like domain-containing protein n=1 Tax=Rhodococcus olei TaxID=2161675 RepID=A0ABP8PJ52_9NOCA